jgi:hypothetical protein
MTDPVRIATEVDVPQIIRLCFELHEENGLASMSEEKVTGLVGRCIARQGGLIGVIGSPTNLEAMIALQIDSLWYTDAEILSELFNFVRADCRHSNHAKRLVSFAKMTAEGMGLPLFIGVISNHRTKAKVRLYRRQLGEPAGAFFIHGQFEGTA